MQYLEILRTRLLSLAVKFTLEDDLGVNLSHNSKPLRAYDECARFGYFKSNSFVNLLYF